MKSLKQLLKKQIYLNSKSYFSTATSSTKKSSVNICKVDNPYTQEIHIEKPFVSKKEIPNYLDNALSASSFLKSVRIFKFI